MKRILNFQCKGIPEDNELKEGLETANNEDCYVHLHYNVWGYPYRVVITPEDTIETVKDRIPKYYGA